MGDNLLPELTDEEKQLLDDPKLYALLCRTAAYRRKHDECLQLRAENERLRELLHRWVALVAVACDDKIDIEAIKQLLSTDSEEE